MNSRIFKLVSLAAGLAFAGLAAAAPGEDPVVVNNRVSYLQLPTARPAGSSAMVQRTDLPDNSKAKIARYIAKSYAPDTQGMQTEKDVVSSVRTSGTRTTCVQSLAPSGGVQQPGSDQVIVVRGDLVNICN